MATINSLGVGSGVLTSELIDKIVAAERSASQLRINTKKAEINAKVSAIGSVRSSLGQLQTAVNGLRDPAAFAASSAQISNTRVAGVTVGATAEIGSHTLEVTSLAAAQVLRSKRFDALTSEVGTGTLQIRFGTTTVDGSGSYTGFAVDASQAGGSITIDSSNNTLAGVRDAINSADLGLRARVVDDGVGLRLVITSTRAGAANSVEIRADAGASPGLAALEFRAGAATSDVNLAQSTAASDAVATIDGVPVRRTTNTLQGIVDGLTFSLTETNAGSPVTVSVSRNSAAITGRVQAFVDAYNGLKSLTDSLTAFDPKEKTGGLLIGDPTLRTVLAQVRRTLGAVVAQLPSDGPRSLSDVGVTSDRTNGYRLQFDSAKFSAALDNDPSAVQGLFASRTNTTDPLIALSTVGQAARSGNYDVHVARLASQARVDGATVAGLAGPIVIDADNDTLRVTVDGVASGDVTLTQGSYADGAALATELQQRINADSALRAARATVTVSAIDNRLELRSARFGSSSSLGIDAVDTDTTAELGLAVLSAATNRGVNVAGSINGIPALGASQVLTLTNTTPSATTGRNFSTQLARAPIVIDSTNKTFTARIDGTTTSPIALAEASYATGAALAAELQSKINADTNLAAAGARSASVSYEDATRTLTFFSGATGSTSEFAFTDVPAATAATLGISVSAGLRGHAGGTGPDGAAGTQLRVLGGGIGARGRLEVVRGVMFDLAATFNNVLGTGGAIANRLGGLNDRLAAVNEEARRLDTRIAATETRLRAQFTAADKAISQLNSTSAYLKQQLDALTASRDR